MSTKSSYSSERRHIFNVACRSTLLSGLLLRAADHSGIRAQFSGRFVRWNCTRARTLPSAKHNPSRNMESDHSRRGLLHVSRKLRGRNPRQRSQRICRTAFASGTWHDSRESHSALAIVISARAAAELPGQSEDGIVFIRHYLDDVPDRFDEPDMMCRSCLSLSWHVFRHEYAQS